MPELKHVVSEWERQTGLEMETTEYAATFSRDVNNYIAVDKEGKVKAKGYYGTASLKKNPEFQICADAISAYLSKGTPLEQTIRGCADINKFVKVRRVTRGAAFIVDGESPEYVGKIVRFYLSNDEKAGMLVTADKGHTVPTSEGCKPIMRYNGSIPSDIDYDRYIAIAEENLTLLGLSLS